MNVQEMVRTLLSIGFTEEAIAVGAKVHKSTISRIFTGKTRYPRCHIANEIGLIFEKYVNNNESPQI
jgi:hypothetical protein